MCNGKKAEICKRGNRSTAVTISDVHNMHLHTTLCLPHTSESRLTIRIRPNVHIVQHLLHFVSIHASLLLFHTLTSKRIVSMNLFTVNVKSVVNNTTHFLSSSIWTHFTGMGKNASTSLMIVQNLTASYWNYRLTIPYLCIYSIHFHNSLIRPISTSFIFEKKGPFCHLNTITRTE